MSWTEIRELKKSSVESTFNKSKIILCKRNMDGQVYAAHGFRDMVHFTIGNEGKKQLCTFFHNNSIRFYELRGYENDMESPSWFKVSSMPNKPDQAASPFLVSLKTKIQELGKVFILHLMKVRFFFFFLSYYIKSNSTSITDKSQRLRESQKMHKPWYH